MSAKSERAVVRAAMPSRAKWDSALALLQEGATGFGRVLVATSDQPATYDWTKRCRQFLKRNARATAKGRRK